MAEKLLGELEHHIDDFVLIPSKGGAFEVKADDQLVYSKLETGRHAEYEEVAGPLRSIVLP